MPQKIVVVGAGPVGSLAALYAAVRGHDVEIYELRSDLRNSEHSSNISQSINLALSERGINSLRKTGLPDLADAVLAETFPMHGRMIHVRKHGQYVRQAQAYDAHGRNLLAMDRTGLNKTLLDHLNSMPNVTFFFHRKLVSVDFRKKLAWFENRTKTDPAKSDDIEVSFDLMIGADGAHSAVRYHLMKFVPMSYQQEYIDKLWCQFHVPPSDKGDFRIPPNYLHIWPQDDAMFIALPNLDKSFTSTLFLTRSGFEELVASGKVVEYFDEKFPGVVPELITEDELRKQFNEHDHFPLISIKCSPYHFGSTGVIVGDSAHAMVPFYGQGMNAGLEDVRVLFEILDKYPGDQAKALSEYSEQRTPDAQTINDLALGNYREMASDVKKPLYLLRKWIEEKLYIYVPSAGWATQYSRVTFSNMRYSEVQAAAQRQAKILNGIVGVTTLSLIGSAALWLGRTGGLQQAKQSVLRSICLLAQQAQKVTKG
ncbi:kynurenine 3-monooxygenase [Parastagonospora nodorum]|nr:kynurenine 3-monooxygenase [Parastagonospora nodorum]KAH4060966.1 kynurenine 3-monooxygenase [Parastagonospora nodorum]KAH4073614.1 kynurenine 3-monooxygenase [Parastagonospora nodorum]KAH4099323.1 kynurenine 3-monooxygenase [Parastagonospora nodorum]KAH4111399.1 kynurenine 3-monooxygenase [Parastagonospora nodorum]